MGPPSVDNFGPTKWRTDDRQFTTDDNVHILNPPGRLTNWREEGRKKDRRGSPKSRETVAVDGFGCLVWFLQEVGPDGTSTHGIVWSWTHHRGPVGGWSRVKGQTRRVHDNLGNPWRKTSDDGGGENETFTEGYVPHTTLNPSGTESPTSREARGGIGQKSRE